MGGHGPGGRVSRGYWIRLKVRVFYFQDKSGHDLALASCELFALPAGLRDEVLRMVNAETKTGDPGLPLRPDSLIISATHTHHGPANYMSSAAYNGFAGPLPDFDPKLLHFLAGRIASAIRQAISDAHRSESTLTSLRFIAAMLLVSSATALSHPSLGMTPAREMQFLPRAERPEPLVPMALSRTVPGISQSIPR